MTKRRISVSAAKAKGRGLQKWACEQISKLTGLDWGYEDDKLIQPRLMGASGTDVILRDKAIILFPYSVECKSAEKWNIPKAIEQAKSNMKPNTEWLLILKKKNMKPIVVIDAEHFFTMFESVQKLQETLEKNCDR